jgi:uncharacterized protein involved in exopolysaccharide biosynthesis
MPEGQLHYVRSYNEPYVGPLPSNRSFASILKAKLWLIMLVTGITVTASGVAYPWLPRFYEATALILLQPTDQKGQPDFGHSTLNAVDENEIQAYSDILASRPILSTVIAAQHLMDDPDFNPTLRSTWITQLRSFLPDADVSPEQAVERTVRNRLVIRRDRKSYVMQVGFKALNPDTAAAMANTLANAFGADQLRRRQDAQRDIVASVANRTNELMTKYLGSEEKAHLYLVESGLIHRDQQRSAEEQLATLSREYALALSQASAAEGRARSLTEMQRAGTLDNSPDVLASTIIRDLKERLITLSSSTGTPSGSAGFGSSPPAALTELRQLIGTEVQRIVRAAQSEAMLSRERADALRDQIAAIDTKTIAWNEAERHWTDLQREADADQKALQDAMARLREQTNLIAVLRPDATIYSAAVAPSHPAFPNLALYSAGTLLLAMVLSGLLLLPAVTAGQRTITHASAVA